MGKPLSWLAFAAVFLFTAAFSINLCATLFGCGCQSFWAGSAAHCNIHNHAGPHCPWCTHGGAGFLASLVPVFAVQAWSIFRISGWPMKTRLLVALLAFPLVGGGIGAIVGWMQGYWNR